MTAAFLGISAHFFSLKDHKRHNVTLSVKRISSPHTADLLEKCLDEWGIPKKNINRILTDNGSNMVAAFKKDASVNGVDKGDDELDEVEEDELENELDEIVESEDDSDTSAPDTVKSDIKNYEA